MPRTYEGALDARGLRVALVLGRFNEIIGERLLAGALDCLRRHGAAEDDLHVVRVPGAFELPLAAKTLASSGQYDAVVCLGAVIRGQTPHFDLVAGEAARGVARAAFDTGVPVSFGVLTTDTLEQAVERAGAKSGNKGWDAALAAIEMVHVLRSLKRER
ncbi:MAG TPA: 6,7-dimethyl-8-ribityllumazine synthase [Candidatus Krumholzibacteria bacterium]|nr:6,7-dimethyl-8-ribityllumazine synthase [Candidatus Krumholzibacteria bacterium]